MQISFYINAIINEPSHKETEQIVQKMNILGFAFTGIKTEPRKETSFYQNDSLMDVNKVALQILQKLEIDTLEQCESMNLIYTWFQDILIWVFLSAKGPRKIEISLLPMNNWLRDFEETRDRRTPDSNRYARLLLNVLEGIAIQNFEVTCDWEYLDEELPENCLAVAISTFDFDKFITTIMNNIIFSNCSIVINTTDMNLPKIEAIKNYFINHEPVEVFLKAKEEIVAKLVIAYEKDQLFLFPLEPYRMKIFNDEHGVDLQFYLRLLLNICNHYPIWELRTNFGSSSF